MTRINCIPVVGLHDKHLLAEYRELPRVFKLARPCNDAPVQYTLGAGHVKFFYDKLRFLYNRQHDIVIEMKRRGFKPTFNPEDLHKRFYSPAQLPLWNSWVPTQKDMALNRARISERLKVMRVSKPFNPETL